MNTPTSIFLGIFIVGAIVLDIVLTGGANLLFLAKKFTDLTEWIAFWR